ncbi:MAG: hypothetical protein MUC50_23380, partial [Myxococcota bacterium]|nr:hypothetical protein [Myxococcota bacterium]
MNHEQGRPGPSSRAALRGQQPTKLLVQGFPIRLVERHGEQPGGFAHHDDVLILVQNGVAVDLVGKAWTPRIDPQLEGISLAHDPPTIEA